jgi:hypothetical protein
MDGRFSDLNVMTVDGMLFPIRKALAEDREVNLIRIETKMPKGQVRPFSHDLLMKAGIIGGK